ncbi:uncharacterized protein LOC111137923 [Crassostrea virginica]
MYISSNACSAMTGCQYYVLVCLSFVLCLRTTIALKCNFGTTHQVNHFNESGFLGTWHETERTTLQWGDNTWHSQVWEFQRGSDGHLYMAYTGYSQQTQSCSSPETGLLTPVGPGASYQLSAEGRYEASLQISYTDYKNIALVYMCYEPEVSGLCNRNRAHVSLLSRTISLTKAQRAVLMGHLDLACIEDGHIEQANTGLCQIPVPLIPVGK